MRYISPMLRAMFEYVVGPDKRNQDVAAAPLRMAGTNFELSSWDAILSL
jgi:hypothetical protein